MEIDVQRFRRELHTMRSIRFRIARTAGAVALLGLSVAMVQPNVAEAASVAQQQDEVVRQGQVGGDKLTADETPGAGQPQSGGQPDLAAATAMYQSCVAAHMRMGVDQESAEKICFLRMLSAIEQQQQQQTTQGQPGAETHANPT
jgi:hypothetical protein